MIKQFVLATNNSHKVLEFKRILSPLSIGIISAAEAGVDLSVVEETGSTFSENSAIKALYAFEKTGVPCIADDSGLCVDSLNGEPGIYSARYAGENATDDDRIRLLLSRLQGVDFIRRKAHFNCSISCVFATDDIVSVEGVCNGYIGFKKCGDNGFGYDPIFYLPNGRSFACIDSAEKDAVSHRGNALKKLYSVLQERIDLYVNK